MEYDKDIDYECAQITLDDAMRHIEKIRKHAENMQMQALRLESALPGEDGRKLNIIVSALANDILDVTDRGSGRTLKLALRIEQERHRKPRM